METVNLVKITDIGMRWDDVEEILKDNRIESEVADREYEYGFEYSEVARKIMLGFMEKEASMK